jgi:hypothetical protein
MSATIEALHASEGAAPMDFEPIIAILGTILVVAIGAAIIKKAVGCAITLVAVAIIAYLVLSFLGAGTFS